MDAKLIAGVHFILVVLAIANVQSQETKCHSYYDFQEKLLEKMVKMTYSFKALEADFQKKLEEISEATANLKLDKLEIQSDFTKLEADFDERLNELAESTDGKIRQTLKDSVKPTVAFLARTVSDIAPYFDANLVFTTAVLNTDNSYSTDTGEFIAPIQGTYMFAVQLCVYDGIYLQVRIYANDAIISDATHFEPKGSFTCQTSNTLAVLEKGDRVYVMTGKNTQAGDLIFQDEFRWSMFMGSLVN